MEISENITIAELASTVAKELIKSEELKDNVIKADVFNIMTNFHSFRNTSF